MMRERSALLAALALCGAGFASGRAEANPLDAYGFGARSIALGGAVTAGANDSSAVYYNPAALARARNLSLELGYADNTPRLYLDGSDANVYPSRGFAGGFVLPGHILGRPVAFSLALFMPNDWITRTRALPQAQSRWVLYDNLPQRAFISTGAAIEVIDDLFLGVALTYLAGTRGTLDLRGVVNNASTDLTRLLSAVDVDFPAVRYPSVGVLYKKGPLQIGATFRDEFVLRLDIAVQVRGDITIGTDQLVAIRDGSFLLHTLNNDLFSPRQAVVGFGYVVPGFSLLFDLTYAEWSHFPAPAAAIDLALDLKGLNFTVPIPDKPRPPGFRDVVTPRVGVEVGVLDRPGFALLLRAGYAYSPTPTPPLPFASTLVDADKHCLSAGAGIEIAVLESIFPQPIGFDLAGHAILLAPQHYARNDPLDPGGSANGSILGLAFTTRIVF
jgi:long-chain fatty acid transport protein